SARRGGRPFRQHGPCRRYRRGRAGGPRPPRLLGGGGGCARGARAPGGAGVPTPLRARAGEGGRKGVLRRVPRANAREPLQVEGDVYALAACNDAGSRRLVEMMEEFGIANLDRLGEHIIETSRQATIEAIGNLKKGCYRNSLRMDGYDR